MLFKDVIGQEEAKQYRKVAFGNSLCPLHLL